MYEIVNEEMNVDKVLLGNEAILHTPNYNFTSLGKRVLPSQLHRMSLDNLGRVGP